MKMKGVINHVQLLRKKKTIPKLSIVDTALIAEIEEFLSRYPEWDYLDAEVVWEALLVAKMGRSFSRAYLYRGYINRGFLMKEVINHV